MIVHTDHATLKHLFSKKDAKPRLIRWILRLKEFDSENWDRKSSENLIANQLPESLSKVSLPYLSAFLTSNYLWFNLNHDMLISSIT